LDAENFHDLPSASWRTRKAGGIIQSPSKGLRTGWEVGKDREDGCPRPNRSKFTLLLPLIFLLYSGPQWIR
jgi:hypothetical protein